MENNGYIKQLMLSFAEENGKSIAFSLYDGKQITDVSYRQFLKDVLSAAGYFFCEKISRQHIAIVADNSYEWIVTLFAIISSGNTAVLLNPALPNDILLLQCKKTDVTIACVENMDSSNLRLTLPNRIKLLPFQEISNAEPMQISEIYTTTVSQTIIMMLTSGTTGSSKAVEFTSENLQSNIASMEGIYVYPGMERVFSVLPFFHISGLGLIFQIMQHFHTLCLGRGTKYTFADMAALNPTNISLVPSILESIVKIYKQTKNPEERHRFFGTNLQRISVGGATLKPNVLRFMMDQGVLIDSIYGMTESTGPCTWCVWNEDNVGSIGKPCDGTECRIEDGELLLKGPSVMKGYYKDPEETAKIIENGWLHTGDLAYCDENGYYYLTGRKKNVIILSNGENVNPEEIEAQFSKCPEILECLVYGDKKGICADVYAVNESAATDFIKKYNEEVPLYRQVYKVYYSSAPLEKTGSGKIKRKENAYV